MHLINIIYVQLGMCTCTSKILWSEVVNCARIHKGFSSEDGCSRAFLSGNQTIRRTSDFICTIKCVKSIFPTLNVHILHGARTMRAQHMKTHMLTAQKFAVVKISRLVFLTLSSKNNTLEIFLFYRDN